MKNLFLSVVSTLITISTFAQTWEDVGGGANWSSHCMTVWDGKLVNGGSYTSPCNRISTWDGTTWECLDDGVGIVARSATEWEGNLVVVGDFWNVHQPCTDCNGIAVWDGTSWSNLGTGFNNDVLVVYNWDGTLVAAGDFTEADGNPCSRIAWWDGSAWQPFGGPTDFDNDIRCVVEFEDELWVGGDFNNVAGCSPCDGLVRWTGSEWVGGDSGVDVQGGVDETVRVLYVSPTDGNLYMGGHFTDLNIDGTPTAFNGVAMYDGSAWTPLESGVDDYVRAIYEYNGSIVVGGAFDNASGTPASKIAKWNLTTLSWEAMGSGMDGTSDVPVVKSSCVWNGAYYGGGTFDTAGGVSAPKIAKWTEPLGPLTSGVGSTDNPTCAGDCNGTASVTVTGGSPPYSYLWDDPLAQTTATADGLCAGTYTCTITDDLGDESTETVVIDDPSGLSASVATSSDYSGEDISCNGETDGSALATPSGGSSPYSYLWDDPSAQTTSEATGLGAGTYEVEITDDYGCTTTETIELTEPDAITLSSSSSEDVNCNGDGDGSATIAVTGGTPSYSYLWDDPMGQTTATASDLNGGTYMVTVTDANGCEFTESFSIDEPDEITIATTVTSSYSGEDISCNGESDGSVSGTPSGGVSPYDYLWDDPSGQTTAEATGLSAGTYTVEVTDDNGCTSIQEITLNEPDPIAGSTSTTTSSCTVEDGSATVTSTGGSGTYTYLWDDPLAQTTATATGLGSGIYSVVVTDENGCEAIFEVTVLDEDGPVPSVSATDVSCYGDCNGEATASATGGSGGYTYEWDAEAGGGTDPTAGSLCSGTFTVTVYDSDGCSGVETITITEPDPITFTASTSPAAPSCDGDATVTPSGGVSPYSYLWDVAAASQTTATAIDLCSGTYCVTIIDDNGCEEDTCVTVQSLSGIAENDKLGFSVYPNPVSKEELTIISQFEEVSTFNLYAVDGTIIRQLTIQEGTNKMDVSDFATGSYIYTITSDLGHLTSGRLIIE